MSHLEVAVVGEAAITNSFPPAGGWDTAAGCVYVGGGVDKEGFGIVSLGVSMATD